MSALNQADALAHSFVRFVDYDGETRFGVFHPHASRANEGEIWRSMGDRRPMFWYDSNGIFAIDPTPFSELALDGEPVSVEADTASCFDLGFIGLTASRVPNCWCGGQIVADLKLCSLRFGKFETQRAVISRDTDGVLKVRIPA